MSELKNCCRQHDLSQCIELIQDGIQAQCVGLEDLQRRDIIAARQHILWGLQKVIEGLRCAEER